MTQAQALTNLHAIPIFQTGRFEHPRRVTVGIFGSRHLSKRPWFRYLGKPPYVPRKRIPASSGASDSRCRQGETWLFTPPPGEANWKEVTYSQTYVPAGVTSKNPPHALLQMIMSPLSHLYGPEM